MASHTGLQAEEEREAFFDNLQKKYNYASFMDSKSADSSPTGMTSKSRKQVLFVLMLS